MEMHKYTQEEIEYLENIAFGKSYKEIRVLFNRKFGLNLPVEKIQGILKRKKIKTGRTGRFKKGHVPANKGTHNGGYEPTQFKKGNMPSNHKQVGTEVIRADGYVWIKTAEPRQWKMKHVAIWEEENGKIPKGHVVIFLDGNRKNVQLDNLAMVERKVALAMNRLGIEKANKELTMQMIEVAKLNVKIAEVKKGS